MVERRFFRFGGCFTCSVSSGFPRSIRSRLSGLRFYGIQIIKCGFIHLRLPTDGTMLSGCCNFCNYHIFFKFSSINIFLSLEPKTNLNGVCGLSMIGRFFVPFFIFLIKGFKMRFIFCFTGIGGAGCRNAATVRA